MGASAAFVDLLHGTCEKAACTWTLTPQRAAFGTFLDPHWQKFSDIHRIELLMLFCYKYFALSLWRILPHSYKNTEAADAPLSRDPFTGKEDNVETRIFKISKQNRILKNCVLCGAG
jgi:hypothetical protein